jgi:hypothetical protein
MPLLRLAFGLTLSDGVTESEEEDHA